MYRRASNVRQNHPLKPLFPYSQQRLILQEIQGILLFLLLLECLDSRWSFCMSVERGHRISRGAALLAAIPVS